MMNSNTEALLLGQALAALSIIQEHLIQQRDKEALKAVNDALRDLHKKVDKHFYQYEVQENEQCKL